MNSCFGQWRIVVWIKALKCSAFFLVVRFPLKSVSSKNMHTSGTMGSPFSLAGSNFYRSEQFSFASERIMPMGNWAPVKITGFDRFSSIKLSAEAVCAIVSVPWSTATAIKIYHNVPELWSANFTMYRAEYRRSQSAVERNTFWCELLFVSIQACIL